MKNVLIGLVVCATLAITVSANNTKEVKVSAKVESCKVVGDHIESLADRRVSAQVVGSMLFRHGNITGYQQQFALADEYHSQQLNLEQLYYSAQCDKEVGINGEQ